MLILMASFQCAWTLLGSRRRGMQQRIWVCRSAMWPAATVREVHKRTYSGTMVLNISFMMFVHGLMRQSETCR